jgi:hypothetical protein
MNSRECGPGFMFLPGGKIVENANPDPCFSRGKNKKLSSLGIFLVRNALQRSRRSLKFSEGRIQLIKINLSPSFCYGGHPNQAFIMTPELCGYGFETLTRTLINCIDIASFFSFLVL